MATTRALAVLLAVALAACGGSGGGGDQDEPEFLVLSDFQEAAVVIGQTDKTSGFADAGGTTNAIGISQPQGQVALGSLYVPDTDNHRILGFLTVPTVDGEAADFVMGQANFTDDASGVTASKFFAPGDVTVAGGRLFLADRGNHRVLIWNTLPLSDVPADVVVGQSNFTTGIFGLSSSRMTNPHALEVAGGRLFVADQENNRVLIWNAIPSSNGVAADVVLGQPDFTSNGIGVSATQMRGPGDLVVVAGRLFVADTNNNRVLIWNTIPTSNGQPADLVMGQPDLDSAGVGGGANGMSSPTGVDSNGTQIFVSESDNARVLVFDALPTANQPSADHVLGQSNFTNDTPNDDNQDGAQDGPSARVMSAPQRVFAAGDQLFVTDLGNARILIFQGQ